MTHVYCCMQDLEKELESELRGDFESVILGLMATPTTYDANCLKDAMKGAGTREAALIGTLATKNAKVHTAGRCRQE